jgi:hypothetical protein
MTDTTTTKTAVAKTLRSAADCIRDLGSGKGGWAWEEVADELDALAAQPQAEVVPEGLQAVPVIAYLHHDSAFSWAGQRVDVSSAKRMVLLEDVEAALSARPPVAQQGAAEAVELEAKRLWETIKILGLSNDRLALQAIRRSIASSPPAASQPVPQGLTAFGMDVHCASCGKRAVESTQHGVRTFPTCPCGGTSFTFYARAALSTTHPAQADEG